MSAALLGVTVVVVVAGLVTGLTLLTGPAGDRGDEVSDDPGRLSTASGVDTGTAEPAPAVNSAAPPETPAEVRTRVEQLLGQHAVLVDRLARSRLRGDADLAQAADAALGANLDGLVAVTAKWVGPAAAEQLEQLWAARVSAAFAYASGTADGDPGVIARARADLEAATKQLSSFLTQSMAPALSADPLQEHSSRVVAQIDAYAKEDYAQAYDLERGSYRRLVDVGTTLAAGIVERRGPLPEDFASTERNLASRLGMLLGEHTELAVDATRSGLAGWPDFPAAAQALDANTAELSAAVAGIVGAQVGQPFALLWADQIDALMAYTRAVAGGDRAARRSALDELRVFAQELGALFAASTDGRLATPAVAAALQDHDTRLLAQLEGYHASDFRSAYAMSSDAYLDIFAFADQAAVAFHQTAAARAPVGGAQTGGSGVAVPAGGP